MTDRNDTGNSNEQSDVHAKRTDDQVMVIQTEVNRRSADLQKRQTSSRELLEGLWASVVPASTRVTLKYSASMIRGAAACFIAPSQDVGSGDSDRDIDIEVIPRKARPSRKIRFKRKRQPRNWLKICLTKAFHSAKIKASRLERRRFERERTVWRWVKKYRRRSAWLSQWGGIIDQWAEVFKHSKENIGTVIGIPRAIS